MRGGKQSPCLEFLFLFVQAKRKRGNIRSEKQIVGERPSLVKKPKNAPYTEEAPSERNFSLIVTPTTISELNTYFEKKCINEIKIL